MCSYHVCQKYKRSCHYYFILCYRTSTPHLYQTSTHMHTCTNAKVHLVHGLKKTTLTLVQFLFLSLSCTAGLCSSWQSHLSSQFFLLFGLWVTDPVDFMGLCSLSRSILVSFTGAETSCCIIEFGLIMRMQQIFSVCNLWRHGAEHLLQQLKYDKSEKRYSQGNLTSKRTCELKNHPPNK